MDSKELIDNVRSYIDEANVEDVTDEVILQALNRAQRKSANIAARKFDALFWASTELATTSGVSRYAIPKEAFGRRIELIEVRQGGISRQLRRIENHQRTTYVSRSTQTTLPVYYSLQKNTIELYPEPSAGVVLDIHYSKKPEDIVKVQGRITSFDLDDDYVVLDEIGSELSTETAGFGAYINFIDFTTGEIKGTAQITSIDEDVGQVTIKATGLTRSRVLLKTVSETLPADLQEDDYVCLVTGTCVPEIPEAYANYLIQHAVVSIKRSLGEEVVVELDDLKQSQEELDKMWVGRESSKRVFKTGNHFVKPHRRYPT